MQEKTFEQIVNDAISAAGPFAPHAWKCDASGAIEVHWEQDEYYGDYTGHGVTLYRSFADNRVVGCRVAGRVIATNPAHETEAQTKERQAASQESLFVPQESLLLPEESR